MSRGSTEKIPSSELAHLTLTLPKGRLLVLEGPGQGTELTLSAGDRIRIGSESSNDLVITDGSVSAEHAVLSHRKDAVHIEDLSSTNGTYVNGARVPEALLPPAAQIQIGRSVLTYRPENQEMVVFPSQAESFQLLRGRSRVMRELFGKLERMAASDLTVLIEGESGTGKELIARSIHQASNRASGPFQVFDCGRASAEFLESELFGHVRGAFTGAFDDREGALVRASGGTLFLDELGELRRELQPKLLRVLESRQVTPLGSNKSVDVDVRLVAATNRELPRMIRDGSFRQDLYYRLAVFQVTSPPLRDRPEDIPLLARKLLESSGKSQQLSDTTVQVLATQQWPGNVRELQNVLSRAGALTSSEWIEPQHLMLIPEEEPDRPSRDLAGRTLREIEKEAIIQTLEASQGNRTTAARTLGIASSTLFEKMKRYEIQ